MCSHDVSVYECNLEARIFRYLLSEERDFALQRVAVVMGSEANRSAGRPVVSMKCGYWIFSTKQADRVLLRGGRLVSSFQVNLAHDRRARRVGRHVLVQEDGVDDGLAGIGRALYRKTHTQTCPRTVQGVRRSGHETSCRNGRFQ